MPQNELLIIDPQVDFCDPERGTLYVDGAENDIAKIASLVSSRGELFDSIHVTLDSHNTLNIAHPVYWERADSGDGNAPVHPEPFTIISADDIQSGRWRASDPAQRVAASKYVQALEADGRYQLCIWPYHCLIGTPGHNVMPVLADALAQWEKKYLRAVDYIWKGVNPRTEHYSAVRAEVPMPDDPNTQTNQRLVEMIRRVDSLYLAGEAGSHCVANTARDLADAGGPGAAAKITLLTDATSPVGGFEAMQQQFIADLSARGMRTSIVADFYSDTR